MKTLEQLLAQWDAGTLSPTDLAELKRRLATAEARAELISEWHLNEAIYDTLRSQPSEARVPSTAPVSQSTRRPALPRRRLFPWLVWHEARLTLRWPLGFALAGCLLLLGVYTYYGQTSVGKLTQVRAQVLIQRGAAQLTAVPGQLLYPGDLIRVPGSGNATVLWDAESTRLNLAANTELRVLNPMRGKRLALRRGLLQAVVAPQPHWRPMIVTTPVAQARVVGTQFSLSATGTVSRLEVLEGAVLFRKTRSIGRDNVREVTVRAGEVAGAAPDTKLEVQYLTGFLSSDLWAVPTGTPLRDAPRRGTLLNQSRQWSAPGASHLTQRLRGYLIAPTTGDYTFWIAPFNTESAAEFWLSTDDTPEHARRISYSNPPATSPDTPTDANAERKLSLTAARTADWNRSRTQRSASQWLVQGRRYYLEVWYEGADIRSLLLGWVVPGQPAGAQPRTIDLAALSPFVQGATADR